jgi:hypothetical protein
VRVLERDFLRCRCLSATFFDPTATVIGPCPPTVFATLRAVPASACLACVVSRHNASDISIATLDGNSPVRSVGTF